MWTGYGILDLSLNVLGSALLIVHLSASFCDTGCKIGLVHILWLADCCDRQTTTRSCCNGETTIFLCVTELRFTYNRILC